MTDIRIGHGYDVHKLGQNRDLIIGGVKIPHTLGLVGHSDADVLLHAIADSLLGALALGDIGKHFPDTDEKYRGISSLKLLKTCVSIAETRGYRLSNVDVTVIAQKPKLSPYIPEMKTNIAFAFGVEPGAVNVKATTEEGLGFTGSGEGIAAHAVVIMERI